MELSLPTLELRPYQRPFWESMEKGANRAILCWPRRSGKDTISLQWTCWDAHRHIGNYWHLFPEKEQARKAIWNGINKDGQRIIDVAFPPELRESKNDQEMRINFKCGSTWQLGGSDRYDALVGTNPRGVVFSEYAIGNPRAYDFIRPILAENGGWALFPYTPRGRNHGFELFEKAGDDPASFCQLLTCDDTGHMSAEALAREQQEMSQELYLQEYFGSFDFGLEGSYYARQMNKAVTDGRVTQVPYDESLPVWPCFDIGLNDSTAIWCLQVHPGGALHWIDYYQNNGEQVKHYADWLRERKYFTPELILPHDGNHKRIGMPRSVADQFRELGFSCTVLKQVSNVQPYIEDCRVAIGKSWFDKANTEQGRSALNAYRREYDDKRQVFKEKPLHDWASDGADAFRTAIQAYNEGRLRTGFSQQPDYSRMHRAAI